MLASIMGNFSTKSSTKKATQDKWLVPSTIQPKIRGTKRKTHNGHITHDRGTFFSG